MGQKRLLQEALSCKGKLALLGTSSLGGAVLAVAQAALIAALLDGVFLQGSSLEELHSQWLFLGGVLLARVLAFWGGEACGAYLAAAIKTSLRRRLAEQLLAMGPVRGAGEATGELLAVLGDGVEHLEAYFVRYLPSLFAAAAVPLMILAVITPRDWPSALLMLVTAPLIPIFMTLIGRMAQWRTRKQWDRLQRLGAHFYDMLQGMLTLKLFGRSKQTVKSVAAASEDFREVTLDVLKVAFLSALVLELLATISTALIAVAVGLRLLYGTMEFYDAMFVLLLAPEFYQPLRQLGAHFHAALAGKAAAERIYSLLEAEQIHQQEPETWRLAGPVAVALEDVSFAYEGGAEVLQKVSLQLQPGKITALVGGSGAGKSTIMSLLLGMITPAAGCIRINERVLTPAGVDAWLRHVAYVPQQPYLFRSTLRENIRLAKPEASEEEVEAAFALAGGAALAAALPKGYETMLGAGGVELSGGERRRVALARAFLADAPVLLCDEATSGLDPESEAALQQSFERLCQGRTVLVIAHRLGTVRRADQIAVLESGQIIEAGNHKELLTQQGAYAALLSAAKGASV